MLDQFVVVSQSGAALRFFTDWDARDKDAYHTAGNVSGARVVRFASAVSLCCRLSNLDAGGPTLDMRWRAARLDVALRPDFPEILARASDPANAQLFAVYVIDADQRHYLAGWTEAGDCQFTQDVAEADTMPEAQARELGLADLLSEIEPGKPWYVIHLADALLGNFPDAEQIVVPEQTPDERRFVVFVVEQVTQRRYFFAGWLDTEQREYTLTLSLDDALALNNLQGARDVANTLCCRYPGQSWGVATRSEILHNDPSRVEWFTFEIEEGPLVDDYEACPVCGRRLDTFQGCSFCLAIERRAKEEAALDAQWERWALNDQAWGEPREAEPDGTPNNMEGSGDGDARE